MNQYSLLHLRISAHLTWEEWGRAPHPGKPLTVIHRSAGSDLHLVVWQERTQQRVHVASTAVLRLWVILGSNGNTVTVVIHLVIQFTKTDCKGLFIWVLLPGVQQSPLFLAKGLVGFSRAETRGPVISCFKCSSRLVLSGNLCISNQSWFSVCGLLLKWRLFLTYRWNQSNRKTKDGVYC